MSTAFQRTQCAVALSPYAFSHNVWNSLSSQHSPPTHMGTKQGKKKQKLLQISRNPPLTTSGCLLKPVEFRSPLWSVMQFCYEYVITSFGPRTRAHAKLYIGLFHFRRSEESSAFTVDGCRRASIGVTNNKNAISCKIVLVQN